MTSIPQTNFIYDRDGNLINVLPVGSSADIYHGQQTLTSDTTTDQTAQSIPLVNAKSVFGYGPNEYPDDIYKITTAHPLVTVDKQLPEINNLPPSFAEYLPEPHPNPENRQFVVDTTHRLRRSVG